MGNCTQIRPESGGCGGVLHDLSAGPRNIYLLAIWPGALPQRTEIAKSTLDSPLVDLFHGFHLSGVAWLPGPCDGDALDHLRRHNNLFLARVCVYQPLSSP